MSDTLSSSFSAQFNSDAERVEREIERDKIIALGRSMRLGLSNETGRYHLRVKKSAVPQVRKVVLRSSIRVKKPTSSELEPPKKVRRRMETVPEPQ